MKKLIIFFAVIAMPCYLLAQNINAQNDNSGEFKPGLLQKDIRATYHGLPQYYKVMSETDTCDSYLFYGKTQIKCYYKNDTCYKFQMISPFDHREVKNIVNDSYLKKIGEDTWINSDGTVEMKETFDEIKDLCTTEFIVVDKKSKK